MEQINFEALEEPGYSWIEIDRQKCNRCGTCLDMCPMDVLYFSRQGWPYMRHRDDCWYCDICAFVCPRQAVTIKDLPYLIR